MENENKRLLLLKEYNELASIAVQKPTRKCRSDKGQRHSEHRKPRSDKGKVRGPNSCQRRDAGRLHPNLVGKTSNPYGQYKRMKSRMLNTPYDPNQPDFIVRVDINQIYIPMVKNSTVIHEEHSIIHRGQKINRTARHVAGYVVDLEKFRFEALQYLILSSADTPLQKDAAVTFAKEYEQFNTDNVFDLFCSLYHIPLREAISWQYNKWRRDYEIVYSSTQPLANNFLFNLSHLPGTIDFMPEYSDQLVLKKNQLLDELFKSKKYIDKRARLYDLEVSRHEQQIKALLLEERESSAWSGTRLASEVRKRVPLESIAKNVDNQILELINKEIADKYE